MLSKITKKLFLPTAFVALAIYGIAGSMDTIVERSFFDSPADALTFIAMLAVSLALWLFGKKINPSLESSLPFFKKICICCVCAFLTEMCVFNFVSLYKGESVTDIPNEAILIDGEPVSSSEILLENTSTITIVGEGANVGCIQMRFSGDDERFKITAKIKDDNKSEKFTSVASVHTAASSGMARMTITPYGKLYAIELKVTELDGILEFEGVSLLSAKPFSFNHSRMFLLLVAVLVVLAVKELSLMKIMFDARKASHQFAVWSLAVLCAGSVIYFKDFKAENLEYPLEYVANVDPYAQMYDSLEKGIAHIDVEVAPELLEVENVYDISQREEAQAPYIFDRAFYNGKYYSYFGIAPTLTFWKPYMALYGELPSVNTAHMFAAFISIFALFGAVLEFLKRYAPRVSLIMLVISLFSAVFMSGIPIALFFGDGYNIAPAFGIMYLLLTLFFGLAAVNSKNNILRCAELAVSGVCFSLCVASRPVLAVGAILLIPAFIAMLRCDKYSIKTKLSGALSFAVPILTGLALIGKYNAQRFGSPFDFGMAYQLTVCDVTQKRLELTGIPAAVFHYFIAPANVADDFPFIGPRLIYFSNYGHYVYNEAIFGAFRFLPILAGVGLTALVLRRKGCSNEKKWVYIIGIVSTVIVALVDFCFGGVNLRYVMDILPVLTLISTAVLLECHNAVKDNRILAAPSSAVCAVIFAQAAVFLLLFGLSIEDVPLIRENPELYCKIKDFIVFWR
ncbi:MAG: hypothetical protein IJO29_06595 [Oscillospiraceae bacterium]|nr:hypothetical protein [Oscillospiraceae bacterium]